MFTCDMAESQTPHVTINGIEAQIAEQLIDYAYTAEVRINQNNVQNLLSAANLLDIPPVREAASRYLDQHMDETNCLWIQSFAEIHSCHALQRKAKAFALKHFSEVIILMVMLLGLLHLFAFLFSECNHLHSKYTL